MAKVSLRLYNREIEKLIDGTHIEEAIAHCKHILQTYPKHIDTYRLLGKAYLENQRYGEATDIFQRVLASVPDDFVAHIGLSIIREDEANLDAALWHMERAYEVQPSNSAIQDELRRLYGRRDGMEPPRIRLTRGALVRMYARGDLYQQAIAEIRALLAEEPQRPDIQALLARMCYLSGKKVEAIEVCGELLNKYPYCYEANRILAEILPGTSRSEDAKIYRQRVISLDPYMAFTSIERPTSHDIPDNAVTVERLDWQQFEDKGYSQPKWADSLGINLDETGVNAQPAREWLGTSNQTTPNPVAPPDQTSAPRQTEKPSMPQAPTILPPASDSEPPIDAIPEWMRDSGWTESTGQANEQENTFSATPLVNEEDETADIKPAAIPDWLQALAPDVPVEEQTAPIDKNFEQLFASTPITAPEPESTVEVHPVSAEPTPSWQVEDAPRLETSQPLAAETAENADIPDWLKGFKSEEKPQAEEALPAWFTEDKVDNPQAMTAAPAAATTPPTAGVGPVEIPGPAEMVEPTATEEIPDWLSEINQAPAAQEPLIQPAESNEPEPAVAQAADELPGWLTELATPQENEEAPLPVTPEDRRSTVSSWIQEAQADNKQPEANETSAPTDETAAPSETAAPGEMPDWMQSLAPTEDKTLAMQAPVEAPGTIAPIESGQDELPDWLQSLGAPETDETQPDLAQAPASVEPGVNEPVAQTPEPSPSEEVAAEAAEPADIALPDWLSEEETAAPQAEAPVQYTPKPTGSLDNWLHKFEAAPSSDIPTQPVKVKPAATVETPAEQAPVAPIQAPEAKEEALPDWLQGLGASQADAVNEKNQTPMPDWLSELESGAPAETKTGEMPAPAVSAVPAETAGELPDWLNEISGGPLEDEKTPSSVTPSDAISSVATPPGAIAPTPQANVPSAESQDSALAWLEGLAAKHGADEETLFVKPEDRSETPPAWVQESAQEESSPIPAVETPQTETAATPGSMAAETGAVQPIEEEQPAQPATLPDWLQELKESPAVETPVSNTPAGADDYAPSADDQDAALAWLEGLAAKHGADEEALFVKPEDRQENAPAWVQQAATDAVVEEPVQTPTAEEPSETPVQAEIPAANAVSQAQADEDAALAWLESLAAKHGADEDTLFVKPEDRQENAPAWVQQATDEATESAVKSEADVIEAPTLDETAQAPVAEAVNPVTTESPANSPGVSQAQADEDAALAWLEGLAAKHGADEETLFVKPEERQQNAPAWVQQAATVAAATDAAAVEAGAASELKPVDDSPVSIAETEPDISAEAEAQAVEATPAVQAPPIQANEPPPATEEPETPLIIYSPALETEPEPVSSIEDTNEVKVKPSTPASEPSGATSETALPDWLRGFETEETEAPTQPILVTPPATAQQKVEAAPQPAEETTTWLTSLAKSEAEQAGTPVTEGTPTRSFNDETVVSKRPEVVPTPPVETRDAVEQKPATGGDNWQNALAQAQAALDDGQVSTALECYTQLINSGQLIDEAIHDLRDALYHYPVEVTIWQTLGDAYMRSNRIQDALDAYTKAEELLR